MQGWNQGANSLGNAMIRIPQIRAMQQNRAAQLAIQSGRANALNAEAGARTEETSAKTKEILQRLTLAEALGQAAPEALKALQSGNVSDPSIGKYVGIASQVTGANKDDVVKTLRETLATALARGGNVAGAAAAENPAAVYKTDSDNAQKAATPIIAPNNSTLFDKSGNPIAQAASTISPSQTRFAPSTGLADALMQTGKGEQPLAKPAAPALPASVQSEVFKSLLANEGGGTNTTTALTGLQKAMGSAPAAQPAQNNSEILKQAQDAINAGADPTAVKARLLKLGIQQ